MKRHNAITKLAFALILAGTAAAGGDGGQLQMYAATVDYGVVSKLRSEGYDIARIRRIPASAEVQIELVLRPHEVAKLKAQGVKLEPWRGADAPGK